MSKFGDLINGSNTPEPIKDYEVTITGIEETPVVQEEESTPDIFSMSKANSSSFFLTPPYPFCFLTHSPPVFRCQ